MQIPPEIGAWFSRPTSITFAPNRVPSVLNTVRRSDTATGDVSRSPMKLVKQSNSQSAQRATPTALNVKWVGTAQFKVPIPRHEKQRVAALDRYHILDSP